jgi:uracil-DNA glycosylase
MGIDKATFYDSTKIAIVPMGFCYPGKGKSGDLPPRRECAPAWRKELLAELENVKVTLVIGTYAISYHLPKYKGRVTQAVTEWESHFPSVIPLPHPSPRNVGWFKKNPWFEAKLVPRIRSAVKKSLR